MSIIIYRAKIGFSIFNAVKQQERFIVTPSILRDFLANKLTIKTLIVEAITDLGGGLYSYMLMLEKQKRDTEAELIKILRTEIFAVRDKYINTGKLTDLHVDRLERTYALFNVQMKMISASKENSWETHMFQSYTNEFLGLIYFLKDKCNSGNETDTDKLIEVHNEHCSQVA